MSGYGDLESLLFSTISIDATQLFPDTYFRKTVTQEKEEGKKAAEVTCSHLSVSLEQAGNGFSVLLAAFLQRYSKLDIKTLNS